MRTRCAFLTAGVFLAAFLVAPVRSGAQGPIPNLNTQDPNPNGKGDRTRNTLAPAAPAGQSVPSGNGISWHGGPVMLGTTNLYYIFYGSWNNANVTTLLLNFASNIGGSPYFAINTTYTDGSGTPVANSVHFAGSTTDSNYSRGKVLNDSDIQIIVSSAITGGQLPADAHGVYFVLTSADVNETTGFCTQYCGWHTYSTISNTNIKYAFVGNADRCPGACAEQSPGPNGTTGPDAMVSVIAHELEEAVTDPNLNAWYDSRGEENADKCAWTFGDTHPASNGALYNMTLGGVQYLIQQNWLNASGGRCDLSYTAVPFPDFSLSAQAISGTVTPGGSATYSVSISPSNGFSDAVILATTGLPTGAGVIFSPNPATTSSTLTVTTTGLLAPGTYPFTIIGFSGSLSHQASASLVVVKPDFSLSAQAISGTVTPGSSATYSVSISPSNGFSSSVTLDTTGLPANAGGSFSPNPAGTSSTLTVTTTGLLAPGTYPFTITGVSGSLNHQASATLVVVSPDFSLSAQAISGTVTPGSSATYSVGITPSNGFAGTVGLGTSGLPANAGVSFSLNPATTSSTLTVTTGSILPGTYPFTITGVSGSLSHQAGATLVVVNLDFSLSAQAISGIVVPGGTATYSVGITPSNGFAGTVGLGTLGLPTNASGSFSPNPANTTSTLAVTTTGPLAPGNYPFTITGVSGSLSHQASAMLVVVSPDFSLSAQAISGTVTAGGSATYGVGITPSNGFAGAVGLGISGLPSGAGGSFSPNPASTSSTLTVTTTGSILPGTYPFTITGVSGSLSHQTSATLVVSPGTFTISATPASKNVSRGSQITYFVLETPNGYNGKVQLSVSGLPAKTNSSFSPASLTGGGSSVLTVKANANAKTGTFTLTITGAGNVTKQTTVTLVIK